MGSKPGSLQISFFPVSCINYFFRTVFFPQFYAYDEVKTESDEEGSYRV